jgi:DNA (cytosine-5)-methyltransferase 1
MTYYPRVVKKPKGTSVNGSVAIFELKDNESVTDEDLKYFSTEEFRKFYAIARNLSTRSLNLDNISVYYFGKKV